MFTLIQAQLGFLSGVKRAHNFNKIRWYSAWHPGLQKIIEWRVKKLGVTWQNRVRWQVWLTYHRYLPRIIDKVTRTNRDFFMEILTSFFILKFSGLLELFFNINSSIRVLSGNLHNKISVDFSFLTWFYNMTRCRVHFKEEIFRFHHTIECKLSII